MKNLLFLLSLSVILAMNLVAGDLSVTVYNSNLGVISEVRELEFEKGTHKVAFRDVPSAIDATSVQFELLDNPDRVAILEQNYAYDLVSPDKIYGKYLDHKIELINKDGHMYSGTLLSFNGGAATLVDETGKISIIGMSNIAHANFPTLPGGMITRPTLFWVYNSSVNGNLAGRVSYQTTGLNWSAEYVGVLDESESNLSLSGWASITNNSGKTYDNAALRLIAGDINRATPPGRIRPRMGDISLAALESSANGFVEKEFFEYHMYTLPRKSSLANQEIKQVAIFDPARTVVEKVYRYQSGSGSKVQVAIKFKNEESSGLGMPLPAGRVRLFKADDDGTMILLGEDRIDHTPTDEEMNIKVGQAFDIVVEERQVSRSKISDKIEERTYEIVLRNHKSESVKVEITKRLYGYWEILDATHQWKKKDAYSITLSPQLPAGGETTITLKVRHTNR